MSSTDLTRTVAASTPAQRHASTEGSNVAVNSTSHAQPSQGSQQTAGQLQTPRAGDKQLQTPQQLTPRNSPRPSTPGQWEHPRMQEILARQRRTVFDQKNVRNILRSGMAMAVLAFGPSLAVEWVIPRSLLSLVPIYAIWMSYFFQLLLLANMALAAAPLFRKQDAIEDIPLTPRQRQLLDLPPMSRPATPQEQASYVTPPRYSRNTTPTSMDSLLVNARGTPLSGRNSPLGNYPSGTPSRVGNNISFSGSGSRRTSDMSTSRRESFGRSSPMNEFEAIGSNNKRMSVGLNSKWLYDRGKHSPTASPLGSGWGTGSVFN